MSILTYLFSDVARNIEYKIFLRIGWCVEFFFFRFIAHKKLDFSESQT